MDRELLLKITQGDYQAYKELFYKYYKSLFTTLHYRTQDKDLADELAQQTFVKVWLNRKVLKPQKSFTAYINTLSANLLKDHFRRLKVRYDYVAAFPDINRFVTRNADDRSVFVERSTDLFRLDSPAFLRMTRLRGIATAD